MDLGVISITGVDATKFLQGQFTCDVNQANNLQAIRGSICNNKGRVVASFWLWQDNGSFTMVLPKNMIDKVMTVLKKYARFSKVIIEDNDAAPLKPLPTLLDTIKSGFAIITPETSEQFTPHELGYPQIGAVSFNKGCYTGQEIVSRMHYRGKSKMHLYHVQIPAKRINHIENIINLVKVYDDIYEVLIVAKDITDNTIKVIKKYE
jgi:tRNA-modifying protein YgfZ